MKKIFVFTAIFLFVCAHAFCTNWYFAASGSDAAAGTIGAPWQTITKFNSINGSEAANDSFLFNRADIFYGAMIIARSTINIGAYGTGVNPNITGFTTVSSWTSIGTNLWESSSAMSTLATCTLVTINGVNMANGRYPNTGYLPYQTFTTSSITSSSLTGSPNWSGGTAVIRKNNYFTDKTTITSQATTVLNLASNPSGISGTANYGFFIQNDSLALDTTGEWYYNPSTKKLRIYNTTSPTNVQATTQDTLVYMSGRNFISFSNINFTGSNTATILFNTSTNLTVLNCQLNYAGIDAILQNGASSDAPTIQGSYINNTGNNAIFLGAGGTNHYIGFDTIKNNATIPGTGSSSGSTYIPITVNALGTIENNWIDSCGHHGIVWNNSNEDIRKNKVSNFNMVKIDGGGIYSYFGIVSGGRSTRTNQKVDSNIILNGIGSNVGTTNSGAPICHGIYLDGLTSSVEVYGNTCAANAFSGIFVNSADSLINVHDNTCYDNGIQFLVYSTVSTLPDKLLSVKHNKFISKTSTEYAASWNTFQAVTDISTFSTAANTDTNYLARPIDDNLTIQITSNNFVSQSNNTLAQWVAYSAFDSHSSKSPKTISTTADLDFEYNSTSSPKTVSLPFNYMDITGATYNGYVTVPAYGSWVGIKNGAIIGSQIINLYGNWKLKNILP
jgi:hypothetical protein